MTGSVNGEQVRANTLYQIRTVCGTPANPIHSAPETATTWHLSDANGDGNVDLDDLLLALAGFAGELDPTGVKSVDVAPCDPNGAIDLDDLLTALAAFSNEEIACPPVCSPGACRAHSTGRGTW